MIELPSYKLPVSPELMEQLKHLTEPRQQKVAAVFLNIIDTVNAVIQEMKSFPPQRRFMGKKNRTPKGRIDKIFRKARMNQLLQLYLAKHCSIISTPIPKYPPGTKAFHSAIVYDTRDTNEEIIMRGAIKNLPITTSVFPKIQDHK